jgi:hypothetical protein
MVDVHAYKVIPDNISKFYSQFLLTIDIIILYFQQLFRMTEQIYFQLLALQRGGVGDMAKLLTYCGCEFFKQKQRSAIDGVNSDNKR